MDFRATSTKGKGPTQRRCAGIILAEAMMAVGVTSLLMLVICSFSMFSGRSFAALFNYVDLDDANRIAMDQLTREIRQANRVTSCTTESVTLEEADGSSLSFTYSPTLRTLTRIKNGVSHVLLRDCDTLTFSVGQRNPINGSYDVYPAATAATTKVVNVSWLCTRTIFGIKENSESVQTARIVIRKQGT